MQNRLRKRKKHYIPIFIVLIFVICILIFNNMQFVKVNKVNDSVTNYVVSNKTNMFLNKEKNIKVDLTEGFYKIIYSSNENFIECDDTYYEDFAKDNLEVFLDSDLYEKIQLKQTENSTCYTYITNEKEINIPYTKTQTISLQKVELDKYKDTKKITNPATYFFANSNNVDEVKYNDFKTMYTFIPNFEAYPNVKEFTFIFQRIDKINNISKLTKLENLNLMNNKIKKIEGLSKLTNLKTLNLMNNKITKIEGLSTLKNLEVLHLEGNDINTVENINQLTSLKEIYLPKSIKYVTEKSYNFIKDNNIKVYTEVEDYTIIEGE